MNRLQTYRIPFVGLKEGIHHFQFEVNDDFFSAFENAEIKGSHINIDLSFDKKSDFFVLDFSIGGKINAECDRCLTMFELELLDENRVYVKFDEAARATDNEEDDIVYISPNDTHIDISQLIYEFIQLSIPVQKNCPLKPDGSSGCNEDVLKILNNQETEINEDADPRWAALKKLK